MNCLWMNRAWMNRSWIERGPHAERISALRYSRVLGRQGGRKRDARVAGRLLHERERRRGRCAWNGARWWRNGTRRAQRFGCGLLPELHQGWQRGAQAWRRCGMARLGRGCRWGRRCCSDWCQVSDAELRGARVHGRLGRRGLSRRLSDGMLARGRSRRARRRSRGRRAMR